MQLLHVCRLIKWKQKLTMDIYHQCLTIYFAHCYVFFRVSQHMKQNLTQPCRLQGFGKDVTLLLCLAMLKGGEWTNRDIYGTLGQWRTQWKMNHLNFKNLLPHLTLVCIPKLVHQTDEKTMTSRFLALWDTMVWLHIKQFLKTMIPFRALTVMKMKFSLLHWECLLLTNSSQGKRAWISGEGDWDWNLCSSGWTSIYFGKWKSSSE